MSDNRTTMRNVLTLLETVEQGKKTQQLNESLKDAHHAATAVEEARNPDLQKLRQHHLAAVLGDRAEKARARAKEKGYDTRSTRASHDAQAAFGIAASGKDPSKYGYDVSKVKRDIGMKEAADHLDPNLQKAYDMGYKAYKAYRNNPELAQAAQDKIEAEFPQYAKMWLKGYRDGETLPQGVAEGQDDNYYHDAAKLAEGALDAAARYIQDELGIESGDNAGMFFQGEAYDAIIRILTDYAEEELQHQRDSDTENVDPSLEEGSDDKQSKLAELEEKLKRVQAMKGSIAAIGVQDLKRKIAKLKSELDVKENFGGGMRDRPGPDHKSFDLAECREFVAKRTLKG